MQQFTILTDGKVTDSTIQSTLANLQAEMPGLDASALEAQMALFRAYAVFFASLASRYTELGLSVPRFNTLSWLYHANDNQLTITELSAHLEASLPSTMSMVQALAREGWLRRYPSKTDKRVTLVQLTEEGRAKFRDLLPTAADIWSEMWSGLTEAEKETLSHLLSKLRMILLSRYIGHDSLLPYKIEAQKRRRFARTRLKGPSQEA